MASSKGSELQREMVLRVKNDQNMQKTWKPRKFMFRILFQRNECIHSLPLSVGNTIVGGLVERMWTTTWNGPRNEKGAKLAQNVKTKEFYVSDPFSTKRMHPFPSSECGEHHSMCPCQKEVNNNVKSSSECKAIKTRAKRENHESLCFGSFFNETKASILFLWVWGAP